MFNRLKKETYLYYLFVLFIIFLTGCNLVPPAATPENPSLPVVNSTQNTSFSHI